MKKFLVILLAFLLLAVAAVAILQRCYSESAVLKRIGMENTQIFHAGENMNGKEYKAVYCQQGDQIQLAVLQKNVLGMWKVTGYSAMQEGENTVSIAWFDLDETAFRREEGPMCSHYVLCGNNGKGSIPSLLRFVPEGGQVEVWQQGSAWRIHVMHTSDTDFGAAQILEVLQELDCLA